MDYFTSETKPTDTITDKINVYGNKASFKHLYKRNENGTEEEVQSVADLNKDIVWGAWTPALIGPPVLTFSIPKEQSYDQGRLRKMLYNLCENTSIACIVWDAENLNDVTSQLSFAFPLNGVVTEFSKPSQCQKYVFNRNVNNDILRAQDTANEFVFLSTNNYTSLKKTLKVTVKGVLLFENSDSAPSIAEVYPGTPHNNAFKDHIMPKGAWIHVPGKQTGESMYSGYHNFDFEFYMTYPNFDSDQIRLYWRELTTLSTFNLSCKIKTLIMTVQNVAGSNTQNI